MYIYQLAQGNPEGTDYSFTLTHDQKFSDEEFQEICETSIVEALEKKGKTEEYVTLSFVDTEILAEILEQKGFKPVEITESYYLEPFWGKEHIKNEKLLQWADAQPSGKPPLM